MSPFDERDARLGGALGHAVRIMGHDLRNKLGVMRNSAYYLNMRIGQQSEKLSKHVGILLNEIDMGNWMVGNLMDLITPKEPAPVAIDMNVLIEDVLRRGCVPQGVEIARMQAANLPEVRADGEQLARAVENVLIYQCASLGEDDSLRLVTRERESKVYIELVDSGPGLSRDQQARLFDLECADGPSALEIGLVVARRLIEMNHGLVEVESREGMGTRFSIVMPTA